MRNWPLLLVLAARVLAAAPAVTAPGDVVKQECRVALEGSL